MNIDLSKINMVEYNGKNYRFLCIDRDCRTNIVAIYDCKDGVIEWVASEVANTSGLPILFISRANSSYSYEAKGDGFSFKFRIIPAQDSYGLMMLQYLTIDTSFKGAKLDVTVPRQILKYDVGFINGLFDTLYVGHEHIDWLSVLLDCEYCIEASDLFQLVRAKRVDLYIASLAKACDICGVVRGNTYIRHLRVEYIGDSDNFILDTYTFAIDMNLKRFELYKLKFKHNCEICNFDKVSYIITDSYTLLGDWLASSVDKCTIFFNLCGISNIQFRAMMQSNLSIDLYSYDRTKYKSLDTMITDCLVRHKRGCLIAFNDESK